MAYKEHVFEIAVCVNDADIERAAVEAAVKKLEKIVTDSYTTYGRANNSLNEIASQVVRDIIEKNKDEIINAAVGKIAQSVRSTKALKEAVGEVLK